MFDLAISTRVITELPSPAQAVWRLGPIPIRAYALCILAGIIVAVIVTTKRWDAAGGRAGGVLDITTYAIPAGILGARAYHVLTSWDQYFGPDGRGWDAVKVWQPGLGIWGAVAGGALGAWVACRRYGYRLVMFADAAAPGIAIAQAFGRWGNWFNNELYGSLTDLPWGLRVHEWNLDRGAAVLNAVGQPVLLPGAYHPTFLYESVWCLGVAGVVFAADRRFQWNHGRSFACYVALYTVGRMFIETLRTDPSMMLWGQRFNVWTSAVVGAMAVGAFVIGTLRARRPSQEKEQSTLTHQSTGKAYPADEDVSP
ncbi:MAG: prolipoprotein diacylglyceryl transferase [Actinomycetota bacterium]